MAPLEPFADYERGPCPYQDDLQTDVNEVWAWHGLRLEVLDPVLNEGFDERVAELNGFYGGGCYLAVNSIKSDQYTPPRGQKVWHGHRHLLYCRVLLGRIY